MEEPDVLSCSFYFSLQLRIVDRHAIIFFSSPLSLALSCSLSLSASIPPSLSLPLHTHIFLSLNHSFLFPFSHSVALTLSLVQVNPKLARGGVVLIAIGIGTYT